MWILYIDWYILRRVPLKHCIGCYRADLVQLFCGQWSKEMRLILSNFLLIFLAASGGCCNPSQLHMGEGPWMICHLIAGHYVSLGVLGLYMGVLAPTPATGRCNWILFKKKQTKLNKLTSAHLKNKRTQLKLHYLRHLPYRLNGTAWQLWLLRTGERRCCKCDADNPQQSYFNCNQLHV